jgi:uroporphyrinogen-III synthase
MNLSNVDSMDSFNDLHVLVTRPSLQAKGWIEALQALSIETTYIPVIEILALEADHDLQAIKNHILELDQYQKAIFVSQNAVDYGADWIDRYWPQLPTDLKFYAIGSATAKRLEQKLAHLNLPALQSAEDTAMNSEALLALPEMETVAGEKIILFRGQGGRPLLSEVLESRGAHVDLCELYQRHRPEKIDYEKFESYRLSEKQTVTSVHSGESLTNLCELIGELEDKSHLPWLKEQALLVPGERVAELAKALGFKTIIVAINAAQKSMLGALHDWRQQ